ncbi:MAG: hypothetical protein OEY86_04315 [Nitrospira sp.]|nr:hypothetical protein [Nitrospira sp.]
MHHPEAHPNVRPETSGKACRYVTHTHAKRPIRFDLESDACLLWTKAQLSVAGNSKDIASLSLVVRRAVRLYRQHVRRLLNDPGSLAAERQEVRKLSQMPGPKRRRRMTPRSVHPFPNTSTH